MCYERKLLKISKQVNIEHLIEKGLSCISKRLRCNGDRDCNNFSDEENCLTIHSPCGSKKYKGIPNINRVGAGFDVTKLREESRVMNNEHYNGNCIITRSGKSGKHYRKPANVQFYRYQFQVGHSFTIKSYESSMSYFQDEQNLFKKKMDAGSSFAHLSSLFSNSSGCNSRKTKMVIDFGTNSDSKFFKISATVQVARFRIIRQNLLLSYDFEYRLKQLPEEFDYAKYIQVISDFGTHFYSSGVLGGEYEFLYRYSKKALLESGLTDSEQKHCLEQEAKVSLFGIGSGVDKYGCSTNPLSKKHQGSFTRSATNFVSDVDGGTSAKASALSFTSGKTPNKTDYDAWVKTVKDYPVVVNYMLTPISIAVPVSNYKKRANLERALILYSKEYDNTKCTGKCAHGAAVVVVNKGKLCKCLCPANYGGIDCNVRA
uniref:complement component C6-like isoform X1 n=1 Tax=Ciona intestinalis TaxID=7719 RepID=UPI000EF4A970|nr:complement component C6-like isoform X1 [Ciona intestinalis]|eukprot:XP_026694202.1 complement component C6-like isoform X1 [Ciona intestinalis]